MIQLRTVLKVADNSGAKVVYCIKVHGGAKRRYAQIGDIITVAVREAIPHSAVKKGEVMKALIVRQKKELRRKDGSYVRFSDNAVVLVDPKNKDPKGSRIFGPIPREIKNQGYAKIASLALEVI